MEIGGTNKAWWIAGGAILIFIIIVALINRDSSSPETSPSPSASTSAVMENKESVSPEPSTVIKPVVKTTGTVGVSYANALKMYEGKRIQFNSACQASPSNMVLKAGDKIMLDNRHEVGKTVSVGASKYNILGYGYLIITPRGSGAYPQKILIDCGKQQNVATISIEK